MSPNSWGFGTALRGAWSPMKGISPRCPWPARPRWTGRVRESVNQVTQVVVAIRTEDLEQTDGGPGALGAKVVSSEFRGREFVSFGDAADGTQLTFRAHTLLAPGTTAQLRADPERALVFRGSTA